MQTLSFIETMFCISGGRRPGPRSATQNVDLLFLHSLSLKPLDQKQDVLPPVKHCKQNHASANCSSAQC